MPQLLEHPQIVTHCKVLNDLRVFQAESMNMFDLEFPAIWSECRTLQRGDKGEVAQVRAIKCDLTHDRVAFRNERVDSKNQIRKSAAPRTDDVLNDSSGIGVLHSEIRERTGEEVVHLVDLPVVPKFLKMALNAILV